MNAKTVLPAVVHHVAAGPGVLVALTGCGGLAVVQDRPILAAVVGVLALLEVLLLVEVQDHPAECPLCARAVRKGAGR